MDKYSPNTVVQNYWIPNIVQNYWKGLLLHSVDIHTFEKQHAAFPYVSKYDLFFFFFTRFTVALQYTLASQR